jgi:hypothetical protein
LLFALGILFLSFIFDGNLQLFWWSPGGKDASALCLLSWPTGHDDQVLVGAEGVRRWMKIIVDAWLVILDSGICRLDVVVYVSDVGMRWYLLMAKEI